jgi:tRNA A-37 threonylcarbamoyl transferase component Bud32
MDERPEERTVRLDRGSDGRAVLVKAAADEAGRARLRAEAEILHAARRPGVVELVEHEEEAGRLVLALAPGATLAARSPASAAELARLGVALAELLSGLHDDRIAHLRIRGEHVLVQADGDVVLCGFGDATTAASAAQRTEDVTALRQLLADRAGALGEPALGAALEATGSFAELAAVLLPLRTGEAAPAVVRRPLTREGTRPRRRAPSKRSVLVALVAAGGLVAGLLSTALLLAGGRSPGPAAAPATTAARTATTPPPATTAVRTATTPPPTTLASTTTATSTTTPPTSPSTTAPEATVDLDGDGRPDRVVTGAGRIAVGSAEFVLGDGDDLVLVGDWDCDGRLRPGLLASPEGWLYLFDRWPVEGETISVAAALELGPVSSAVVLGGGCPELRIAGPDGVRRRVPLGRSA